jgi:integrase
MRENTILDLVDRAARRAGLREKGPHKLRHTLCSLGMKGVPVRAIHELARHQHLSTTQRYNMHQSPGAIEGAIRMLEQRSTMPAVGDILETAGGAVRNWRIHREKWRAA